MSIRLATSAGLRKFPLTATCLVLHPPCRTVYLMHAVKSGKKMALNKKLQNFKPVPGYEIATIVTKKHAKKRPKKRSNEGVKGEADISIDPNESLLLELWNDSPRRKIGVMDISSAKKDHIRPGFILAPFIEEEKEFEGYQPTSDASVQRNQDDRNADKPDTQPENDKDSNDQNVPKYLLTQIKTIPTKTEGVSLRGRSAKLVYFQAGTTKDYFAHMLEKAYGFISLNMHVEFHIIAAPRGKISTGSSSGRSYTGNGFLGGEIELSQFNLRDEENLAKLKLHPGQLLHFRPDVILQALPEESYIAISPRADYREFAWVIGPPVSSKKKSPQKIVKSNLKILEKAIKDNVGRKKQILLERTRLERLVKEFEQATTEDSAENRLEVQDTCMQREAIVEKTSTRFSRKQAHKTQALREELAEEFEAEKEVAIQDFLTEPEELQSLNANPRQEEKERRSAIVSVTPIPAAVSPIESEKEVRKETVSKKAVQEPRWNGVEELSKKDWKRLRLYANIESKMKNIGTNAKKFSNLQSRAKRLENYDIVKHYLERNRPPEPFLQESVGNEPLGKVPPWARVELVRHIRRKELKKEKQLQMKELKRKIREEKKSKAIDQPADREYDPPGYSKKDLKRATELLEKDSPLLSDRTHTVEVRRVMTRMAKGEKECYMDEMDNSKIPSKFAEIKGVKTETAHKREDNFTVKVKYESLEPMTRDALQSASKTQSRIDLFLKNDQKRFEPQLGFSTTKSEDPKSETELFPVVLLRLVRKLASRSKQ